jgi:hypothetical protein
MTTDFFAAVSEATQRVRPALTVITSAEIGSFDDAFVEMRDGRVLWRIIRERSVLGLVVAPEFDHSVWYDVDLVRRLLGSDGACGREIGGATEVLQEVMTGSLDDLVEDLERLRPFVAAAFDEFTWEQTRQRLTELGRRRDAELFGRPPLRGT